MLHLSKNSMFKLKYSHENHIYSFENICCAYDHFGSKHPTVEAVTSFIVQNMHDYVKKQYYSACKYKKFISEAKSDASYSYSSGLGLYKESYLVHT